MAKRSDKKSSRRATEISVLAELERYVFKYEWAGDDEVKVKCPFHHDETPSCNVNVKTGVFKCHGASCGQKGEIVTLLAGQAKTTRQVVLEDLAQRYDLEDVKIVEPEVIARWHDGIWKAAPLLAELRKRAITDSMIKEHRLGEHQGRVTIPISNARGDVVNVRHYLPGAPGPEKMKNTRGRAAVRWFPIDQLRFDSIALVGGEMKAIVLAPQLNKHGCGVLCATQGEGAIPPELLRQLAGKTVFVGMDIDEGGRRANKLILQALRPLAAELFDVLWPLDLTKFPKGDPNDFVAEGGDAWELFQSLEPWVPPVAGASLEEPESVHLGAASDARLVGKRVTTEAIVTAMDAAPYFVPKDVIVECDKSQAFCGLCPAFASLDGKFELMPESPAVLECVCSNKRGLHEAMMHAVGVPGLCKVCKFNVQSHYRAEDVRLTPQLEITSRAADQKVQPAIAIGDGLELNDSYAMTGRVYPHPATQQSVLLVSGYEQTKDALSTYQARDLERLDRFQPAEWTAKSIKSKLNELYEDFERTVTRITQRRDLHLAMDLSWHSPLHLLVDHRPAKGWIEVLAVGDSAQGKSDIANGIRNHYGLGEKVECKNLSAAGLIGGLVQQANGRWMIQWGFWPTHDKRHLTLEEMKGMSIEVIAKATEMRSSGIAELSKIEKRRTHARTRILGNSNCRGDREVASYSYGVEAIRDLIGALEDIRRFDLCMVVARNEVDAKGIEKFVKSLNGQVTQWPGDLCRSLVLWAWTRKPEECEISQEVKVACAEASTRLCEKFTDKIPIMDRGSGRFKVMRLAAALAARTFSCSEDRQSLVVRECHVEFIEEFLDKTYSAPAFGYLEYSRAVASIGELLDPEMIKQRVAALPFPNAFVESILRQDKIEFQDFQDWCGWERKDASELLSYLVRKHALLRENRIYRKTGPFIELLRRVAGCKDLPGRPDHIPETEF